MKDEDKGKEVKQRRKGSRRCGKMGRKTRSKKRRRTVQEEKGKKRRFESQFLKVVLLL